MYVDRMLAIGAKLRRQPIDDWGNPAKPEPEPKADQQAGQHSEELYNPFAGLRVYALFRGTGTMSTLQ